MILVEYLVWILVFGILNFAFIHLRWIYEQNPHHLFWRKKHAAYYYAAAAVLFLAALMVYFTALPNYHLLLPLVGSYVLCAAAAVKVNDRGLLANGMLVRWHDIVRVVRQAQSNRVVIVTARRWWRMRLEVPGSFAPRFRKMLASKRIRVVDEEGADPVANSDYAVVHD